MKKKNPKLKEIEKIKRKIIPTLKKYKIKGAGIFGSYVRGEQKKRSDIDILVDFNDNLLTLVGIEREVKKVLKTKVDLLTYKGINPLLKKQILKEEVRII